MGKVGKAAPYPRLSREDGDDDVSESIVNQIQFIRSFVERVVFTSISGIIIFKRRKGCCFNDI